MRHSLPRMVRFLLYSGVSFLFILIVLAGLIQVEERIFRHRAERLLDDIRSIDLRHTTFQQVGASSERWTVFFSHDVPCSKEHCDFRIVFGAPGFGPASTLLNRMFADSYWLLGGHAAAVVATINVRNGFVWGESYSLGVDYELIGEIATRPWAETYNLVSPSFRKHPEYDIGRYPCRGCVGIEVHFSPFADPADIRRLSQFNFACVTRLRRCRREEDIMPIAMAQAWKKEERIEDGHEQLNCEFGSIQIMSRDLENAAVVDVIDNHEVLENDPDEGRILRVRLIERIKRATLWQLGTMGTVETRASLAFPPMNDLKSLRLGDRVIILFTSDGAQKHVAEMCGVMPYTAANLAMVRLGAAQNDRVPPLIEYSPEYRPHKFSDPPGPPPPPAALLTH